MAMDECVDQQGFDLIVFNSVAQYFNCLAHTSDMPDRYLESHFFIFNVRY